MQSKKFAEHISLKGKKEKAMVRLIRRNFPHLDVPLFRKMFTTFIRPNLEYGQVV